MRYAAGRSRYQNGGQLKSFAELALDNSAAVFAALYLGDPALHEVCVFRQPQLNHQQDVVRNVGRHEREPADPEISRFDSNDSKGRGTMRGAVIESHTQCALVRHARTSTTVGLYLFGGSWPRAR